MNVPAQVRTKRGATALAWALVCAGIAGCGATDDRPPVWEYLSPAIFQPSCATASCHSRATAVSGLDFSTPERGFRSLTGLRVIVVDPSGNVDDTNGRPLVTPFDPGQSRVVNMLRARGAARMPPDRPLSEPDIRLIEAWILRGATRSVPLVDGGGRDVADAGSGPDSGDASVTTDARDATAPSDVSDASDASDARDGTAAGDLGQ